MNEPVLKKVLLLGGSGFIGRSILRSLLNDTNDEIIALAHKTPLNIEPSPRLKIIHGSIGGLNLQELQPDIIIHAARNRTGKFGAIGRWAVAKKGEAENRGLLAQIKALHNKPLTIYCSGSLMYGSHKGVAIDETFPLNPVSFARQYITAERPFIEASQRQQVPLIMLRLPWVIGNGSWFYWNYLRWMQERKEVPVYGQGENVMSFIDVDVIGKAILGLTETSFTGTLNVFHPRYLLQWEWAELVSEVSGMPVKKLTTGAFRQLPAAVRSAFETNIQLTSKHEDVQRQLEHLHRPLPAIVQKHLSAFQDK